MGDDVDRSTSWEKGTEQVLVEERDIDRKRSTRVGEVGRVSRDQFTALPGIENLDSDKAKRKRASKNILGCIRQRNSFSIPEHLTARETGTDILFMAETLLVDIERLNDKEAGNLCTIAANEPDEGFETVVPKSNS